MTLLNPSTLMNQLIVAPILLPLLTAALMLILGEKRRPLKAQINLLSTVLGLAISICLFICATSSLLASAPSPTVK